MFGVFNFTERSQYEPRFTLLPMVLICVILGIIIIWTIVGNVLVLVTIVTELKINSSSNHLIFSLAITDLMVAVTVMPLSVIREVSVHWWLGLVLCDMWIFIDVMSCTASIFHLVVIAIDRYLSITKLTYSRNKSLRSTSLMIASAWVAAIIVSVPSRFHLKRNNEQEAIIVEYNGTCIINQQSSYTILSNFLSFCFPLLVIGFIYIKIFTFILKQTKNRKAILNSVIGTDALTMAMTNEYSYTPSQQIWNDKNSMIVPDENSFATVSSESSLIQSSWIDDILQTLPFADDDDEESNKQSTIPSPDNISSKVFNSFDKLSLNSLQHSFNLTHTLSSIEGLKGSNIAEQERLSSDEDNQLFTVKTIRDRRSEFVNKSIIKSPLSTSNKLRSPTLSWSPKFTFYSYHRAKINNISSPDVHNKSDSLSNQDKSHLIQPSPSPMVISECHNNSSFKTLANRNKRVHQKREYRVARTLFILTGLFLFCWMPFAVNNVLRAYVFKSTSNIHDVIDSVFLWLGYINSGLNPIIYTIFSPDFQAAFRRIICGNKVDL